MHHYSDSQKADRLNKVTVGNVARTDSAVAFSIKKPTPLPLETVSTAQSAAEISRLLGVDKGVAVSEVDAGYSVVLTGAAKAAYDKLQAAAAERDAKAAQTSR